MAEREKHRWNHSICMTCWDEKNPGRGPVTVGEQPAGSEEDCCFCGAKTLDGIYVRHEPKPELKCQAAA